MAVECTEDELLEIVENILALDTAMRFAAILDLNGKILDGIMKESKTLENSARANIAKITISKSIRNVLVFPIMTKYTLSQCIF